MVGDALGVEPHGHALLVPAVIRELVRACFDRVGILQLRLRAVSFGELDSHRRRTRLGGLAKDQGVAVCWAFGAQTVAVFGEAVLRLVQRHVRVQVHGDDGEGLWGGVLETALFLRVSFLGVASMQAARKAMVAPGDRFMHIV